jgi:septal ring factor EnvC (AmiA/AmiB activator)
MDAADKQWFETLLVNMSQQIDRRFEQIDRRFEQIDRRFEKVEQRIEHVETSLLTEFHKWASPTEARLRSHAATLRALDLKVEALDDRIKKLEGGANSN